MALEKYASSLMENLITVLAYDKTEGQIVASLLNPNLMEGDYRVVAERCQEYWRKYKKPPGNHTADLFSDIIEERGDRRAPMLKRTLVAMQRLSGSVNTRYVLDQLRAFHRTQRIKATIVESAEKINSQDHMAVEEVEEMWQTILREQEQDFNRGTELRDVRKVFDRIRSVSDEFSMGIKTLDKRGIKPQRSTLMMLIAPPGRGKSWWLCSIAKRAIMDRKKVVYISLEMDEEDVVSRLYQSIMAIPLTGDEFEITSIKRKLGKVTGLERKTMRPTMHFGSKSIELEINSFLDQLGRKADNLVVKRFTPNKLTGNELRAYLDSLEQSGFAADMVIVDYLGIMKNDPRNLRITMGHNAVDLRAIAIERNLAMVSAHQASKAGEEAMTVKTTHIAEDFSIVGTADWIITYSCSEREFAHGLARLFVGKARRRRDRWGVLITQAYDIGQFCLSDMFLDNSYFEHLEELTGDADDDAADDDDD
jgi:replicative DNA helicase